MMDVGFSYLISLISEHKGILFSNEDTVLKNAFVYTHVCMTCMYMHANTGMRISTQFQVGNLTFFPACIQLETWKLGHY